MSDAMVRTSFPGLDDFYSDGWIAGEPTVIKSGKEATVYRCPAGPAVGATFLAAKLYRSRQQRRFKNDAIYQQGRALTVESHEGRLLRGNRRPDRRLLRSLRKKTRAGRSTQYLSWVEAEYQTLTRLYAAGADVPQPFARSSKAVLMEWVGDHIQPAPLLQHCTLSPVEARRLCEQLLHNVGLWLACDRVHGDLSAFNILYWDGRLKVIDFPQAVNPRENPSAFTLLVRDIENIGHYFGRSGMHVDALEWTTLLWERYLTGELRPSALT